MTYCQVCDTVWYHADVKQLKIFKVSSQLYKSKHRCYYKIKSLQVNWILIESF